MLSLILPCTIRLQHASASCEGLEILREIPYKRWVLRGLWRSNPVIIKLFWHPRHAKRHLQREKQGYQMLQKKGFLSPELLYTGEGIYLPDNRICQIAIYTYLADAQSLNHDLTVTQPSLWQDLIELTAKLHAKGLYQSDLHLKNFLNFKQQFYLLDTATLYQQGNTLKRKKSLDNLGLLFAQVPIMDASLWQTWYKIYAQIRHWAIHAADLYILKQRIYAWHRLRLRRYLKKIERNSSEFARIKTDTSLLYYNKLQASPELLAGLKNLPQLFNQATVLKAGNTCTVVQLNLPNQDLIVKRYNNKGVWYALKHLGQISRARNCWRHGHLLRLLAIATAKPIAMLELQRGFSKEAYYICEFVPGMRLDFSLKSLDLPLMQQVTTLLKSLAQFNIAHGDMKASNILVSKNKAYLIDLDAMALYGKGYRKHLRRDRQRFLKNWQDKPEIYQHFLQLLNLPE